MTVAFTRTDLNAMGLRLTAARSKDAAASRRMLAIAMVLEGASRSDAARAAGMDRATLRNWVHWYNEIGLEGLKNQPNSGAPPCELTPDQEASIADLVRLGPDLEKHKLVRWRLVEIRDQLHQRFGVQFHERTVGKLMARLNFSHVSERPIHPAQDLATQEPHKKILPTWLLGPSQSTRAISP